jgi:GTP-binding protein
MRRQDFEFEVSKPEAIIKEVDGKRMEPVEALTIDTRENYIGVLSEILSNRLAKLTNMHNDEQGNVRLEYHVPTRGLIGFRSAFLTAVRGEGILSTIFLGYEPWMGEVVSMRTGMLVASEEGMSITYGLNNAQQRGVTCIEAGVHVYEGMIVGMHARGKDLPINVCKEKKKTNVRSSTSDIAIKLTPALKLSLEEAMSLINDDELLEVTPKNIRMRKKLLNHEKRLRAMHDADR